MAVKNVRFSDHKEISKEIHADFINRKRTTVEQIRTFFLMGLVVLTGVSVIVYNDSQLGATICLVVGVVMLIVSAKYEKMRLQLHSAEFLNALLASALSANHKLSMIVRPGGDILYLDRAFQLIFPDFLEQPGRTIDSLFDLYPIDGDGRGKIADGLNKGTPTTFNISIAGGLDKTPHSLTLSIEPIARPKGFLLIRAKAA